MRIQLVTQMWPSPAEPDLGSFLVPLVSEFERLGHEVEVTSISQRGGSRVKYPRLVADATSSARRFDPDVIFAHFLFPAGAAGAIASLATRAPLVVMAHGQDVANLESVPGVTVATRRVISRSTGVIVNSRWLADRLLVTIGSAEDKITIANCGIDLDAFSPGDAAEARAALGWDPAGPAFLCVGSLIERKNVERLGRAFSAYRDQHPQAELAFVGDGPLRDSLEGRDGIRLVGRIPQSEVPRWVAACDVLCQPSLIEPFGQATLEGMAMERTVIATLNGGPPEFVPPEAGILIDPEDDQQLLRALGEASSLPSPNPAAREAAAANDVRIMAARMIGVLESAAG